MKRSSMKYMRRWRAVCLIFFVCMGALFVVPPVEVQAEQVWPEGSEIASPSAIVMEVNTGTILYEKSSHEENYPASITKILTTLLAIEYCDMDETVVFSADAVYKNEGDTSHIARDLNEELTMEQCLYAVMLESANECAYAAAEHVGAKLGGDYSTFIELMNEKAKSLGCQNTHFNNANGLPDPEHWTSAYDMALIGRAAYQNETFRTICGTGTYIIPPTNKHSEQTICHNHHRMLYPYQGTQDYLYDYCKGGKTGYTDAARSTLVTFAEKNGMTLVCVVMHTGSPNQYLDTTTLFNYCFDNYQVWNIAEYETSIADEQLDYVGLMNTNPAFVTLDTDAYIVLPVTADFSEATFSLDKNTTDNTIAELKYTYGDQEVGRVDIVTAEVEIPQVLFEQKQELPAEPDVRVVEVKPIVIVLIAVGCIALVVLIIFAIRFFDNFYVIRHNLELKKDRRERFRVNKVKKKRRRKKDRLFH